MNFFELVRAGLFPSNDARILAHGTVVNWETVFRLRKSSR